MKYERSCKRTIMLLWLLLAAAIITAGVVGWMLWTDDREYVVGDDVYDAVSAIAHNTVTEQTVVDKETDDGTVKTMLISDYVEVNKSGEKLVISEKTPKKESINWAGLKKLNGNVIAWLKNPGTAIDYPVVRANDYSYYLNHLIDGTSNKNGTLFLDFNNASDFSDELTVIYGHHMKSGRMFGTLCEYKKQSYYEQHPTMLLNTMGCDYRIELIYGCVVGADDWKQNGYMYKENLGSLLEYARQHTTFQSGRSYTDEARFIALSTCSYEYEGARYVVLGVLKPTIQEENANGIK